MTTCCQNMLSGVNVFLVMSSTEWGRTRRVQKGTLNRVRHLGTLIQREENKRVTSLTRGRSMQSLSANRVWALQQ